MTVGVICLCDFSKEVTGAFYSSSDNTWNARLGLSLLAVYNVLMQLDNMNSMTNKLHSVVVDETDRITPSFALLHNVSFKCKSI
jgi:hypothetical protein